MRGRRTWIFVGCICVLLTACVPHKKIAYFQDLQNDSTITSFVDKHISTVETSDLLSISIASLSDDANTLFELQTGSDDPNYASNTYLVREDSTIQIPVLGKLKVAGKATGLVAEEVRAALEPYLKDPTVVVRIVNYRVTLMGEVAKPGVYHIPNEKVSILEAIGMAGDLTIYGKREQVKIIRTSGGEHQVFFLDLTSKTIFTSPNFFLQNNDIVYVEPSKGKTSLDDNVYRILPLIISTLTLIIVVVGFANTQ